MVTNTQLTLFGVTRLHQRDNLPPRLNNGKSLQGDFSPAKVDPIRLDVAADKLYYFIRFFLSVFTSCRVEAYPCLLVLTAQLCSRLSQVTR